MLPAYHITDKGCNVMNVTDGVSCRVISHYSQGIGFCGICLLKQDGGCFIVHWQTLMTSVFYFDIPSTFSSRRTICRLMTTGATHLEKSACSGEGCRLCRLT